MLISNKTPEQTAKDLIEENVSIETYESVQNRRLERLKLWKERNVQPLIEKETELVEFGEKVLAILKLKKQDDTH